MNGGSTQAQDASLRLAPINGLRGIAILAVIWFHIVCGLWPASAVPVWVSPFLTNGWTGVNLFFILSGFVLFLPYAAGERSMQTPRDRLGFYRRRALRLMPLFYVAVIAEWLLQAAFGGASAREFFSVAGLAFIFDPRSFMPTFNLALWSIGVEIAFSLLFPYLVDIAGPRKLGRVLGCVLVVALAARLAGIARNPALSGGNFNSDMFLCRLDEFVIGMMLAKLYAGQRLPRNATLCALAGVALVLCAWTGFDHVLRGGLPPLTRAVLNNLLDAGLSLIVCAALVPGKSLASVLSFAPLQVLGMMCYSLYIWHAPLLARLMPDRPGMGDGAFAAGVVLFAILTFAIAAFTYRFVEFRKVRDWRSLFLLPPPEPAVATAGST